jgi:hypothetical protein
MSDSNSFREESNGITALTTLCDYFKNECKVTCKDKGIKLSTTIRYAMALKDADLMKSHLTNLHKLYTKYSDGIIENDKDYIDRDFKLEVGKSGQTIMEIGTIYTILSEEQKDYVHKHLLKAYLSICPTEDIQVIKQYLEEVNTRLKGTDIMKKSSEGLGKSFEKIADKLKQNGFNPTDGKELNGGAVKQILKQLADDDGEDIATSITDVIKNATGQENMQDLIKGVMNGVMPKMGEVVKKMTGDNKEEAQKIVSADPNEDDIEKALKTLGMGKLGKKERKKIKKVKAGKRKDD